MVTRTNCIFQVGSDNGLVEWEHEFFRLVGEVAGNDGTSGRYVRMVREGGTSGRYVRTVREDGT